MSDKTKFEEDLQAYFPEIHRLHELGKVDLNLWEAVNTLLAMNTDLATGSITINYTKGHIDGVRRQIDVLAFKGKRPGY